MTAQCEVTAKRATGRSMSLFERYLTVWVGLCIVAGIALGHWFPAPFQAIGRMELAQVNLPVAVLIWLMIIPMLLKVDFGALHQVKEHWRGIGVTLFINWAVKPFSMALLGWLFVRGVFAPYLPADQLDSYIAGLILLAAAPCTAMVFVWSRLSDGDANFTLTQVALDDTIMIFAFAPIVGLLLGLSAITVPWDTLFLSVVLYIVIPVLFAQWWRRRLLRRGGESALQARLDPQDRAASGHDHGGLVSVRARRRSRGHDPGRTALRAAHRRDGRGRGRRRIRRRVSESARAGAPRAGAPTGVRRSL